MRIVHTVSSTSDKWRIRVLRVAYRHEPRESPVGTKWQSDQRGSLGRLKLVMKFQTLLILPRWDRNGSQLSCAQLGEGDQVAVKLCTRHHVQIHPSCTKFRGAQCTWLALAVHARETVLVNQIESHGCAFAEIFSLFICVASSLR